jgi:hypothetical protein
MTATALPLSGPWSTSNRASSRSRLPGGVGHLLFLVWGIFCVVDFGWELVWLLLDIGV